MIDKVSTYIEKHGLLTLDKPVIVGVSGGADSVALLVALCELGYDCVAAHCNFHLRSVESDRDAEFVRILSDYLGVDFYRIDFDTAGYAAEKRISVEMAARELRYPWFERLRMALNAQAIAVAHHAQDSVETVLLNLVRGTGIKGLTGIQPKNGYLVRPFLAVAKKEITDWLDRRKWAYVTDGSNLSDDYTRNFLRLRVIPLLEEINPALTQAITRTAGNLCDTQAVYAHAVNAFHQKILAAPDCLLIAPLMKTPAPKTILYEYLKQYGFSRSVTKTIFDALDGESGKRFYSATHQLLKDRGRLLLQPLLTPDARRDFYSIEEEMTQITEPVKLSFRKDVLYTMGDIAKDKNSATLAWDGLRFPLQLRRWREGDWFVPHGMKGRKKVSDYFTDMKFSLFKKEKTWLLCSNDDIVWIVGERIDNRFRIKKTPDQALIIHFFE